MAVMADGRKAARDAGTQLWAATGAGGYTAQQESTIRWLHRSAHFARLASVVSDPLLRNGLRILSSRCRCHATDPQMS